MQVEDLVKVSRTKKQRRMRCNHKGSAISYVRYSNGAIHKRSLCPQCNASRYLSFTEVERKELGLDAKEEVVLKVARKVMKKAGSKWYLSRRWRELRYRALIKHGRQCQMCGAKPPDVVLHVDHIKPKMKHPELAFSLSNLQVLCEACNMGKGKESEEDFR